MKQLRDYQVDIATKGQGILARAGILYLALAVRTGKTSTSLEVARLYKAKNVLFLTKKKAIDGILDDYIQFGYDKYFTITVTNDESMHKILNPSMFDLVIHDEHHRFSAIPKPGTATKMFRKMFSHLPMVFLSGTPSPETFSQMYHQFWVSDRSPWINYSNFYKWAHDYVNITQKRIGSFMHNDYTGGIEAKIMGDISHLMLTYTQEAAGFTSEIKETVLYVDMKPSTISIIDKLMKDLVVEGKDEVILADTAAKLMQKMHQLWSGTCKFESGNSMVIDTSKAEFIKQHFAGHKLAMMYIFKEELNLISQVFGAENITNDLDEFNSTDKHFVGQVVSSREGISLKAADYLVMYNIQHSAVSYFQAKDRLTTIDRPNNEVFWIFSNGGIEEKIYKVVKAKKRYTTNIFKKDYSL
jgi:hypothetical protein